MSSPHVSLISNTSAHFQRCLPCWLGTKHCNETSPHANYFISFYILIINLDDRQQRIHNGCPTCFTALLLHHCARVAMHLLRLRQAGVGQSHHTEVVVGAPHASVTRPSMTRPLQRWFLKGTPKKRAVEPVGLDDMNMYQLVVRDMTDSSYMGTRTIKNAVLKPPTKAGWAIKRGPQKLCVNVG